MGALPKWGVHPPLPPPPPNAQNTKKPSKTWRDLRSLIASKELTEICGEWATAQGYRNPCTIISGWEPSSPFDGKFPQATWTRAVGNAHFCDTTRASQRLKPQVSKGEIPKSISEVVGKPPSDPTSLTWTPRLGGFDGGPSTRRPASPASLMSQDCSCRILPTCGFRVDMTEITAKGTQPLLSSGKRRGVLDRQSHGTHKNRGFGGPKYMKIVAIGGVYPSN